MSSTHQLGQRLSFDGALCTIRYIGEVAGTTGLWLGVEWDDPLRGRHDGRHQGIRYFECISKSPTTASFIRPSRPADRPQSFISAIREKYASEVAHGNVPIASAAQIEISGKIVEEVGFDKIRRRLARIEDLKIVILDGMRILSVSSGDGASVKETCSGIMELDLSHNLFAEFRVVVEICKDLPDLRSLRLSGNRFRDLIDAPGHAGATAAFTGVKELALDETFLSWDEICQLTAAFPSLTSLSCGTNQVPQLLSKLPPNVSTLTSLNLEFNEFNALSDLTPLTSLATIRNLHLKGNTISAIASTQASIPIFSSTLGYLDISYNEVADWSFVDSLQTVFPGLAALRLAHNPVYDNPDPTNTQPNRAIAEEAHMIATARLPGLKTLNFVSISPNDRANAEMFYLSRIAKELAAVPEGEEAAVLARHPLYAALCHQYGEPDVIRRQELNPEFLEARLIAVSFQFTREGLTARETRQIPKSFDIYSVKGIAGRLFGVPPLKLRLVWETGEWDPVAGFDEEEGNSSEEEEAEADMERAYSVLGVRGDFHVDRKTGRWVRREVELKHGPRQLGFCVDGLEAKIRVEVR